MMLRLPRRIIQSFKIIATQGVLLGGLVLVTSSPATAGWEVQWIDSFEGSGVDWRNWNPQTKANYNNEVQCYTSDDYSDERNYDVSDGTLKIIARKKLHSCATLGGQTKSWTSGRLNSKDKQEFLYGRIEARIRFHNLEGGTWPAFWMLENRIAEQPVKGDGDNVGWPNPGAGEIDVWEWFSNEPSTYITNFFNSSGCGSEVRYHYPNGADDVLDWHKYALEWTPESIDFYMNETLVASQNVTGCQQYNEPMFILLNVAMGGNLGGSIDPALQTATMEVDYVAHCLSTDDNTAVYCDESTPKNESLIPPSPLPETQLSLHQNGEETEIVDPFGGEVVVTLQVELSDEQVQEYSIYWQADDIPSPSMQGYTFSFEPESMLNDDYRLKVSLIHDTDEALDINNELIIQVRRNQKEPEADKSDSETTEIPPTSTSSSGGSGSIPTLFGLLALLFLRRKAFK
ncbi:glycoside hydrolase family 16 protein [Vibrio sp. ZSDZ34]|uniref:Glycoside hydrolase family 16 protein n=1 Tax=Vibrio gelatinilyticus TaxID=2893468 RepID=A0A9X1W8G8_9VIBR|nr:glycoside hydrolase family 16 protein [Vibrio gelatinilyticus]MCJ2376307.1 glycoside hydrolase family 16 protein [Vibrio gelatinilyticus]